MALTYFHVLKKDLDYFLVDKIEPKTGKLSDGESRHCLRTLRHKTGDFIMVIDGLGSFCEVQIIDNSNYSCVYQCVSDRKISSKKPLLHIGIGALKNSDRLEWFVEKTVELGIAEITFIETEHSERSRVNLSRIQKIANSALKQSRQFYMPIINDLEPIDRFLTNCRSKLKFIAHVSGTEHLFEVRKFTERVCVLIGPEGDFSQKEIQQSLDFGFKVVSLGNNRLRTETAGVYAASICRNHFI